MSISSKVRISPQVKPLLAALAAGAVALLLLWWMQSSTKTVAYDPAKHARVRVVTIDPAKQKQCLDQYPGEQRASVGYLRCTEGYVYERQQDFFIDKPARPGP